MTTDEDLILGLEFEGAKNCVRLFAGEIDEWMVYNLESDGIRKFSMLATSNGRGFGVDQLIKLREVCVKNKFPVPLELASTIGKKKNVILGLLYPPFQTIQQYYSAKGFTSEFASILKSLLSELVDLHDAQQYPWAISSASIVILDGMKGAWFLNPNHNSGGQSKTSLAADLSRLHTMLKEMLSDADSSGPMSCFLVCLSGLTMANTSRVKQVRLLKCPLFYSQPDEYWTLIGNAYEGLRDDHQYKSLLESMTAPHWQTQLVGSYAQIRGEMKVVLDCANSNCRNLDNFAELVTYLRHFKQHGNERRLQMKQLIAMRHNLNCNLTKSSIHNFPYTQTVGDFCSHVGLSYHDYNTHLRTLMRCINQNLGAPSTGPADPLDQQLFHDINRLYPTFFGDIFAASFNQNVKQVFRGFD